MSAVILSVWAQTDVGMQRADNEDSFLVADLSTGAIGLSSETASHEVGKRGSLLVVSDGMGGAAHGEIASDMAVTTLREVLHSDDETEIADRLRKSAEIANDRIWTLAQNNPELNGMGATLTAALVCGNTAYIAQVGDSRAYLIRGDQIKQITKDQSLVQMLMDYGVIRPDQVNQVPPNVIMQALGTQPDVKVSMTEVRLADRDCLLLCSDGLSNKMNADELRKAVIKAGELNAACSDLVSTANQRGGEDNITVVLARFSGEGLDGTANRPITGSLSHLGPDFFAQKMMDLALAQSEENEAAANAQESALPAPSEEMRLRADRDSGAAAATSQRAEPETDGPALERSEAATDKLIPPDGDERGEATTGPLRSDVGTDRGSPEGNAAGKTAVDENTDDVDTLEVTLPSANDLNTAETKPVNTDDTDTVEVSRPDISDVETVDAKRSSTDDVNTVENEALNTDDVDTLETTRPRLARKSYMFIVIVALISLMLVGATAYFFYSLYLKPTPEPVAAP
jgi:protein phosphatase